MKLQCDTPYRGHLTYLHVVVKCESLLGGHGKARRTVIGKISVYKHYF